MRIALPVNKAFSNLWTKLSGEPSLFSMENRIFNSTTVVSFGLLVILLPYCYLIGLVDVCYLITAVLVLLSYLYYLSRFQKKFTRSVVIFAIFSYLSLALNYYLNSGIKGPTTFLFFLTFQLLISISTNKQHVYWIVAHVLLLLLLLGFEYYNTSWITDTYKNREVYFIDVGFTYVLCITIIYFITMHLRNSYATEKKLAEERAQAIEEQHSRILAQHQELEQVNQEKTKLFSIISHDLRAPINSIQGYLELLSDAALPEEEKKEISAELVHLTQGTSEMLNNLLLWSKTQMHGVTVQTETLHVYEAVRHILQVQGPLAYKKGISVISTVEPSIRVLADRNMLHLILRNLVNNAIKFTLPDGQIEISASRSDRFCRISVRDNGIGIPPEKQRDIFTLQASSSYGTSNEKGVGLGLHLCRELTEMQGGNMEFASTPGKGSEFSLSLPMA